MLGNNLITKDLGAVSAYAQAVEAGFTGSQEDWVKRISQSAKQEDMDAVETGLTDLTNTVNQKEATLNSTLVHKPVAPLSPDGTDGQLLRTHGDGTTEWVDEGLPTDAQTATAVTAWLNAHPEATTTVQDGAITRAKLDADLQEKTDMVPDLKQALSSEIEIYNGWVPGYYYGSGSTTHIDTSDIRSSTTSVCQRIEVNPGEVYYYTGECKTNNPRWYAVLSDSETANVLAIGSSGVADRRQIRITQSDAKYLIVNARIDHEHLLIKDPNRHIILPGMDANDFVDDGDYYWDGGAVKNNVANVPQEIARPFILTVKKEINHANYFVQILNKLATDGVQAIYIRYHVSDFSEWENLTDINRSEIEELVTDVADLKTKWGGTSDLTVTIDAESSGKYIAENGSTEVTSGMNYTSLVPVQTGTCLLTYDYSGTTLAVRIHGYAQDGRWLMQLANTTSRTQSLGFAVPDGVYGIRVSLPASATNIKIVNSCTVDDKLIVLSRATNENELKHDVPENQGVLNVIKRAYQMSKIGYNTVAPLPKWTEGYYAEGLFKKGIIYSAPREKMNYCPQCASFEAYCTAAKNPNSYLYTEEITGSRLAHAYYGAVCSSLVGYAFGIADVIPTTISIPSYPGFEQLPEECQNVQSLKLGDTLNYSPGGVSGHIVIITDIVRDNRGVIQQIEITETYAPIARTHSFDPEYFTEHYFEGGYTAYRYANIAAVPFAESDWVSPFNDPINPTWNQNIMPRRGNKANWRSGETVEIDVMDAGNYSGYTVTNLDTETTLTGNITSLISLANVQPGRYSVKLTAGANESDPVYFNVMGEESTFTKIDSTHVHATYETNMGTPASIQYFAIRNDQYNWYGFAFHILTDEEIEAGEATLTLPEESSYVLNHVWGMRVMYKTEYGLYGGEIHTLTMN